MYCREERCSRSLRLSVCESALLHDAVYTIKVVEPPEKIMIIGVPKEVKDHESRVGVTPAGVKALVEAGHKVLVEH